MGTEIERRWLLHRIDKKRLPTVLKKEELQSGYVEVLRPHQNFRVRIANGQNAVVTFKRGVGMCREESEHVARDLSLAQWMMKRCDHSLEKVRWHLQDGWELDFFKPPLGGLTILEKELPATQSVALPNWAEGEEVTDFLTNLQLARIATDLKGPYGKELHTVYKSLLKKIPIIVLTGGPGSGKDGVINVIKNEFTDLHFTPEAASIIIGQLGILPDKTGYGTYKLQETMYRMQCLFEAAATDFAIHRKKIAIVTNRGRVDAAAYFKGGPAHYEELLRTSYQMEYAKCDMVICLDIPRKEVYEDQFANNPCRSESYEEALDVGRLIKTVWQKHPNFVFITRTKSWEEKVEQVRRELRNFLSR